MFLVAMVLGFTALYITYRSTEGTITAVNEQTAVRIREGTELMWNEGDVQNLIYSNSSFILDELGDLLKNGYANIDYLYINYTIRAFLDPVVQTKEYLHSIYIYTENEKNYFFVSSFGLKNRQSFEDIAWLDRINDVPENVSQWFEIRDFGEYSPSSFAGGLISLYERLYALDKTKPIGAVVINYRQRYLNNFYKNYLSYPGQVIVLLNNGNVILSSTADYEDATHIMSYHEDKYFIAREVNSNYGVTYISMVPKNIIWSQSEFMIRIVVITFILVIVLGFAFAYIIIKTRFEMQLAEEKYEFDSMRFSLLQSQLNPHFLFNTLKNIFWKTVKLTEAPNDASRMIDLLTLLLRYAITNNGRYVTIGEEVKNTKNYISIQEMRFNNSFTVEWKVDKNVLEARCLKFILQPLVENSLNHGINDKVKGIIIITIKEIKGRIFFSIADNGHGFTKERLEEIITKLQEEKFPLKNIGLYNLNKRLILSYGESSRLCIFSEKEKETLISFIIPLKREAE
jgi:two-component system sensor histidine kinase YesM